MPYTGQGLTAGLPNVDLDDPSDAFGPNDNYLMWVVSANGAMSATINLPDGTHTMKPVGGTFKFSSKFFSPAEMTATPVTATYEGTVKGKVQLTVSHGHAADTNVPANTWTTANGGTVPGDFGTSPVFRYKAVQDRNYSWQSSLGNLFTSVQHVVQTDMAVDATPIKGDVSGKIVGYMLTTPHIDGTSSSSTRSGVEEGANPDGGSFVKWVMWDPTTDPATATDTPFGMKLPFTNNIKSGLAVNGEWLTTV